MAVQPARFHGEDACQNNQSAISNLVENGLDEMSLISPLSNEPSGVSGEFFLVAGGATAEMLKDARMTLTSGGFYALTIEVPNSRSDDLVHCPAQVQGPALCS
jgi:hypothetical protein